MDKPYDVEIGDEKISPLIRKLLVEGRAMELESEGALKFYEVGDHHVKIIARWAKDQDRFGYVYSISGEKEDIEEFERLFNNS